MSFAAHGQVASARVVKDPESGRSRVVEARPKEDHPPRDSRGSRHP
ncbi:hypothetical protein [Prosthecobacter sp.]